MDILVINAGSSSLKYQLINMETEKVIAKGLCERIGSEDSFHKYDVDGSSVVDNRLLKDHQAAIDVVLDSLVSGPHAPISSVDEIDAVGHRIVQGGAYFDKSALIDDDVKAKILKLAELAPLHNRAAILGIEACQAVMPDLMQVAVFDTSFFVSLPQKAYMYPIPYELYEKYAIRKYGAHGTSHRYISQRAAKLLGEPLNDLKMITCHLGNGCSITAIDHGMAVDTSMGMTPLDGVMMGTRCGSIDPAIVPFIMEHENLNSEEMSNLMNRQSGLLGISGISNDMRTIVEAVATGNERALLAYTMFANSVKKYIGQYMALMAGVDVIVLTGGIGENSPDIRRAIFAGMQPMGIVVDNAKNHQRGFERIISHEKSKVRICVVPTNEELMIARDTYDIVHEHSQIVRVDQ